jgi:hypothetical protein
MALTATYFPSLPRFMLSDVQSPRLTYVIVSHPSEKEH